MIWIIIYLIGVPVYCIITTILIFIAKLKDLTIDDKKIRDYNVRRRAFFIYPFIWPLLFAWALMKFPFLVFKFLNKEFDQK